MLASADAPAQLVQLADAEPVGIDHHHHRRIRHVDADLDDGGTHQDIDLARPECGHHRVLLIGRKPAVHEPEPQPGQRAAPQAVEQLDHRGGRRSAVSLRGLVALVDAGGDDIGLAARADLFDDALPGPVEPLPAFPW